MSSSSGIEVPATSNSTGKPKQVKLVLLGIKYKIKPYDFFLLLYTNNYYYIGESAVGKSSLVLRFVNRDYVENREPTIGGTTALLKKIYQNSFTYFIFWQLRF